MTEFRERKAQPGLPLLQRYPSGEKHGGKIFQGDQLGRKKWEMVQGKGKAEARKEMSRQLLSSAASILPKLLHSHKWPQACAAGVPDSE